MKEEKKPDFKDKLILKIIQCIIPLLFVLTGCEKVRIQQETDEKSINSCLLSDEDLVMPTDKNASEVKAEWTKWISRNHYIFRSLTFNDYILYNKFKKHFL